jgi:predicted tellurium resistance membrane protein TerC
MCLGTAGRGERRGAKDEGLGEGLNQGLDQEVEEALLIASELSFDSILSALAISKVFLVLAAAIVITGVLMLVMANVVSEFLKKNRKYEVLGLFILLIVGVVLLGEGGHAAHLKLFGYAVEPMAKTTFYFSIAVLVAVDVIQSGYQRKLSVERGRGALAAKDGSEDEQRPA